jgi:hypothetical protein
MFPDPSLQFLRVGDPVSSDVADREKIVYFSSSFSGLFVPLFLLDLKEIVNLMCLETELYFLTFSSYQIKMV